MLKIKNLAVFFSLLFNLIYLNVKAQIAETTPSVSETKNALLWEVTGKDLKKPSYVFGTIHMIPKADFALSDKARKAISESEKVIFEINMKDMQNPFKLLGLMTKIMMDKNQRLRDLVSADDYSIVKAKFDSIGLPLGMFERMKPMFLSMMVETGGEGGNIMDAQSNSKNTAYEIEIMKIAEKDKKEMGGLETMEFQMGIFDSIPYKVQAEMLVKGIKEGGSSGGDDFKKLVALYKSEDIEAMASSIKAESGAGENGEASKYEQLLLINRNKNWIPLMSKAMAKQTAFFAVGAGHLGGELGVISLLKKEGYTLKPLK